jgi:FkbM family methyltransferase
LINNQVRNLINEQFRDLTDRLDRKGPIRIPSGDDEPQEPEIALAQYLYSYLPSRYALDVGANVGHFSARLLKSGYKVAAFEPFEPAFNQLRKRLDSYPDFQAFRFGLGASDSSMALHVAADTSGEDRFPDPSLYNSFVDHSLMRGLEFTNIVPAEVRSLETLQRDGVVPGQVGFLKVDTEGFDLQVLRGMGDGDFSVVMTEFWDEEHPFGRSGVGRPECLIKEMKGRGFLWYLMIYHLNDNATVSFYCNRPQSIPGAWGNILFFRSNEVFREARRWCEAMLRPTLFG